MSVPELSKPSCETICGQPKFGLKMRGNLLSVKRGSFHRSVLG
jgi:hypothetical protein